MKNRWALVGLAVVLVAAAAYWFSGSREGADVEIELIDRLDTATKKSNVPPGENFSVVEVDINGDKRRAINAHPDSRIIWKVQVPRNAWLRGGMALKPDAWSKEGDGVLFRVGVSDGKVYEELLNQAVNPFAVPGDRRWVPVMVDLSAYADHEVEIVFNTNASRPGGNDPRNDWAVWSQPQVFLKR
jgi:hypothetical protein